MLCKIIRALTVLKSHAAVAQLVEHVHGKHEVLGSIPSRSSIIVILLI